jgi:hypothetical protein
VPVQAIAGELFHGQILLTSGSINEALGVNLLEKLGFIAFSNAIKPKEIPGLY